MTCTARLWDEPDGLVCVREDVHDATARGGHGFAAGAGCDLDNGSPTTPKRHVGSGEQ